MNNDGLTLNQLAERNAVLVTEVEKLRAERDQLAAENVALKSAVTQQIELRAKIKNAGRPPHADFWVQSICEAEDKVNLALKETPATERIVAEAEARGVEKAIAHLEKKFSNIGVQIMNLQWLADSLREGADK